MWKQEGTHTLLLASSEVSYCGYCPTEESSTCWFTEVSLHSQKHCRKVPLAVKVLPALYASFCRRLKPAPNILSVTLSICAVEEVTVWGWGELRWARFLDSFVENRQSGYRGWLTELGAEGDWCIPLCSLAGSAHRPCIFLQLNCNH